MKGVVQESVQSVIHEFQHNPYAFLYEEDIRATLYHEIRSRMPEEIIVRGTGSPEHEYHLRRVYCEYGNKIDIACLNFDQIDDSCLSHKGYDTFIYNLPVEIGIELKYRKIGDKFSVQKAFNDHQKLARLGIKNPLALAFIQNEPDLDDFLGSVKAQDISMKPFNSDLDGVFVISKNKIMKIELPIP